ncbi:hypothetical protein ZWY2020_015041 [Hordeum vulgare]|nr:hypothetical protein ZWY2020_015041 [Hordeum vulgare]
MEASRFGFQTAPAFKFDPTDADLGAHYLRPRAVGVRDPPFAHAIIDDDPASLPPADLFAKHGHGGSHHAFFLQTADDAPESRERGVKGGAGGRWRGQKACRDSHPGPPRRRRADIQYRRPSSPAKATRRGDDAECRRGHHRLGHARVPDRVAAAPGDSAQPHQQGHGGPAAGRRRRCSKLRSLVLLIREAGRAANIVTRQESYIG